MRNFSFLASERYAKKKNFANIFFFTANHSLRRKSEGNLVETTVKESNGRTRHGKKHTTEKSTNL